MKTFYNFAPFFFYTILLLVASVVLQHADAHPLTSQRDGYKLAMKLWEDRKNNNNDNDNGPYKCTLDGVVLQFWTDVKNNTFKECDKKYFLNLQRIEACKEGAEIFVREKANTCATDSDCRRLGGSLFAAKAVSEIFCTSNGIATSVVQPEEFFPPVCKYVANRECIIESRLEVETLVNTSRCGTVTLPLSNQQNAVIEHECWHFIRDWSIQSLLTHD